MRLAGITAITKDGDDGISMAKNEAGFEKLNRNNVAS
jgi:hypothetical protein